MSQHLAAASARRQGGAEDGLEQPRRAWAMLAIGLAATMAVLDGTISNVALPTIAHALHAAPATAIWVVSAYQIAITVSLLPLASLGEIIGYERVYRGGLVVFLIGSLACALSASLPQLVAARILQGFGAAGVMAVNGALIRFIFPSRMLGRGIGVMAMVVAGATVVGPTIAAGVLAVASWPWLFAVNLPVGLAALLVGARTLPRTPQSGRAFDWRSAVLSGLCLALLIGALGGLEGRLGGGGRLAALLAALPCNLALVQRQAGQAAPLLPVDLLRIPVFALSVLTSIASFAAQNLAFIALPFYLQVNLGRSEVQTGLLLTPWPLALVLVAPLAGRLSDRMSPGLLGAIGLLCLAMGLALTAALPAHPTDLALALRLAVCGVGFGLFQTPNNRALLQSAPRHRSGGASGLQSTARLLGQSTGAAVATVLFTSGGATQCIEVAVGIALVAAGVSAWRIRAVA